MTTEEHTVTIEENSTELITQEEVLVAKSPREARTEAAKITNRRTLYAAGIGLIPFPIVDAALVVGVQVWMIRDIAKVYGVEFKEQLVKSAITTLIGNLGVVGSIKLIPGLGSVIGGFTTALAAGAATFALGKVFTQHFSQGGTLLNFDPVSSQAYFQQAFEEGKLVVSDLKEVEKDSKKLPSFKGVWNKWIKKSPPKEEMVVEQTEDNSATLEELQKTNEELKLAISKLQETMTSLQNSQAK